MQNKHDLEAYDYLRAFLGPFLVTVFILTGTTLSNWIGRSLLNDESTSFYFAFVLSSVAIIYITAKIVDRLGLKTFHYRRSWKLLMLGFIGCMMGWVSTVWLINTFFWTNGPPA